MRSTFCWVLVTLLACTTTLADQQQSAAPFVLGYANKLIGVPGEEITFHLSSSGASVRMVIERQEDTNETVFEKADIACAAHPIPDRASSDGCNWPAALTMTIPQDWKSGCYVATLILNTDDKETRSSLQFVVRSAEPGKNAKILLQLSTNTGLRRCGTILKNTSPMAATLHSSAAIPAAGRCAVKITDAC
ncbi:MAG TPA: hypothetical protein PLR25_24635 [Planctomycetaceae bacterium]|nr:hypothetical protein [Planctomycetaceae bacterium]